MDGFVATWGLETVRTAVRLSAIFVIMALLERLFAKERQSALSRVKALVFWSLSVPIIAGVSTAMVMFWKAAHLPSLHVPMWFQSTHPLVSGVGYLAAPILGAIVGDFFFYWMHRAQHAFFWRFHSIHHSIREMNGIASYHHLSEELFRGAMIYIPTLFLIPDVGTVAPWLAVMIALQGFYLHSCTRLHLGPLVRIIGDNRFHRIHHSLEPRHFDKNFSGFSPIWDMLFGTAYFPEADEWPATGLADAPEPELISDYLARPFRRQQAAVSNNVIAPIAPATAGSVRHST
ncbi:MAG: sterol desaturase family protein [Caulobacteraceae bacterium]